MKSSIYQPITLFFFFYFLPPAEYQFVTYAKLGADVISNAKSNTSLEGCFITKML